jgi:type I pullulanase
MRPGEGRSFAWSNRENGRLILSLANDSPAAPLLDEAGFYLDDSRVLDGFFVATSSRGDFHASNAEYLDCGPDGARVVFFPDAEDVLTLSLAAIHRERALWLSLEGGERGSGIGLSFFRSVTPMRWSRVEVSGLTAYRDERGVAIASSRPFTLEESGAFSVICRPCAEEGREGERPVMPFTLYCAFTGTSTHERVLPDAGVASLALGLVSGDAIGAHRKGIADFLARRACRTGDPVLDAARELSLVNAWTFLPSSSGSDPFSAFSFRDLAFLLAGFLLPQGLFARAREALISLSARLARGSGPHGSGRSGGGTDRNGADATPLFALSCWFYLEATGDRATFDSTREAAFGSLDDALARGCDDAGLLLHGAHDTRLDGGMTCRGDRAVEVEALWQCALSLGSRMAQVWGDAERERRYAAAAAVARESFGRFFWDPRARALADRLPPGAYGAENADFSVRPNQLFACVVPNLLDGLGEGVSRDVLASVARELATPFGVASLSPDDPLFHPRLSEEGFYGPESSRDNGPVDFRMTLLFARCLGTEGLDNPLRDALLRNCAIVLLGSPFAGFLPRSIGVPASADSAPSFAGAVPDLVSTAAFASLVASSREGLDDRLSGSFIPASVREAGRGNGDVLELRGIFSLLDRAPFPERDLAPPWCGAVHVPRFLESLRDETGFDSLAGEDRFTAALSWYFDSDRFFRASVGNLPLGALWGPERTVFRLWAPTAREVSVLLYASGSPETAEPRSVVPMRRLADGAETGGVWEALVTGDLHGAYYAYSVRVHGVTRITADPRARACGANGIRSMVADFSRTDPDFWASVKSPFVDSPNDVVAYELHVADLTASPYWGGPESLSRTYPGAALAGTSRDGAPTGFDHVRSLGVTHVQLLPVADFSSVDETRTRDAAYRARTVNGLFNWGYDPFNASAPEGSYSTDPGDGLARVRELKSLVAAFARAGIGVIMDVVYNHVPASRRHPLALSVPGYFFRLNRYSGAGDDTASERPMCRAWIVDSLAWWLSEYRLSGFRFDLMGLHDVETMRAVEDRLRGIRADVVLYGEGWDMYRGRKRGRALVAASMLVPRKLSGFGFFNDAFRCGVKGSAFSPGAPGFVHDGSRREAVKFGLVGAVFHPQVRNASVTGTANPNPWTDRTSSSIPYVEIHDNMTLHDKLVAVEPGRDDADYARLQRLSIALVLLAQGMPVLHAGMEFMRTKEIPRDLFPAADSSPDALPPDVFRVPSGNATGSFRAFSHNSYNLCDRVNALDWDRRARWDSLVEYARGLIALRKGHPVFRLRTGEAVARLLSFLGESGDGGESVGSGVRYPETVLAWTIRGDGTGDSWKAALMLCNVSALPVTLALPASPSGKPWRLVSDGERVFPDGERGLVERPSVPIAAKALYVYADF